MPTWQNHEHRITSLEMIMGGLSKQMEGVENSMNKVEQTIQRGNDDQKAQLDLFYSQMADEFFTKKATTHEAKLSIYVKIIGGIAGAGGIVYAVVDLVARMS